MRVVSWLVCAAGCADALRPVASRRSVVAAAPAVLLAPAVSRAAEPDDLLYPAAIYAGSDWIVDRKITVIDGDEKNAELAWRALGGAGAFEVLHKEQYRVGFLPSSAQATFNSAKFPQWASAAAGAVVADRAGEVAARSGATGASWGGGTLSFAASDGARYALKVLDRKVEDIGRGQIGTSETFLVDGSTAVKIARGFSPAPLAEMFGVTEVVTTYPVAGGVATSTTKSRLHYERPGYRYEK